MRKWKLFVIVFTLSVFVMRNLFSTDEKNGIYSGQPEIIKKPQIDNWNMSAGITVYILVMALLATDKENLQWFSKRKMDNK
jgi:hypothetical protein